jgi:hypothetical protein
MDWNGGPQAIWARPIQSRDRSFAVMMTGDTYSIRGLVSFSAGTDQNYPLPSTIGSSAPVLHINSQAGLASRFDHSTG